MSDRAYTKAQAQQKTLTGSSPSSRLLQRTCACGGSPDIDGLCTECREKRLSHNSRRGFEAPSASAVAQGNSSTDESVPSLDSVMDRASCFGHDFSQIPIYPTQTAALQPKLKISQPGDVYEQEADRAARQITQKQNPSFQVQRHSTNQSESYIAPPIVDEVLHSSGQPLDTSTRTFMESRLGHDFSQVRIHTDTQASESARVINALAYTVNPDVVFRAGQYAPETMMGRQLLAHELTHVVQQRVAGGPDFPKRVLQKEGSVQQPTIQIQGPMRWLQRQGDDDNGSSDDKSRQSKPKDTPRGTIPIDQSDLSKDEIHKIKDGIGAGPKDWVGITPEGHVIAGDHEGNAEDHGPASDYYRKAEGGTTLPSFSQVITVLEVLGLSLTLAAVVIAALADPEPATKLALAGLSVVMIGKILKMFGRKAPVEVAEADAHDNIQEEKAV